MKKNLYKYLSGNEYPGRGICIGLSPDGNRALIGYWAKRCWPRPASMSSRCWL